MQQSLVGNRLHRAWALLALPFVLFEWRRAQFARRSVMGQMLNDGASADGLGDDRHVELSHVPRQHLLSVARAEMAGSMARPRVGKDGQYKRQKEGPRMTVGVQKEARSTNPLTYRPHGTVQDWWELRSRAPRFLGDRMMFARLQHTSSPQFLLPFCQWDTHPLDQAGMVRSICDSDGHGCLGRTGVEGCVIQLRSIAQVHYVCSGHALGSLNGFWSCAPSSTFVRSSLAS